MNNCAREPIHRPGKIQAHGLLLITDALGERILCASENVATQLGLRTADVVGARVDDLSPGSFPDLAHVLKEMLRTDRSGTDPSALPHEIRSDGKHFNVFLRKGPDDLKLFEFEAYQPATDHDIQARLFSAFTRIRSPHLDISRVLDHAAQEVKKVTGFARVMIYRFHEDWHGEVVAEACDPSLGTFMGLHFPASDIPPQARDLYTRHHIRQIPDVGSETFELVAAPGHENLVSTDLSNVESRAVSPVHIQYLKNMGIGASFSISIISHGRLWGLIACHNLSPLVLPHSVRTTCLLIGQLLAVSLDADIEREKNVLNAQADQALRDLGSVLLTDRPLGSILDDHASMIATLFSADGLWSNIGGEISTFGLQPGAYGLLDLFSQMEAANAGPVFVTDRITELVADGSELPFAGVLGIRLQRSTNEFLFLLRRERKQTVNWAGLPQKSDEPFQQNGFATLGPRKSFEIWEEEVKGISEKWSLLDRTLGEKLRLLLLDALNQRSARTRILNEKLKEAYAEMEAFSYTISHDLRVPLNSIANYAEMIIEELDHTPTDEVRELVKGISRGTVRMSNLIDHVLEHSRLGKVAVKKSKIAMMELITDIRRDVEARYRGRKPQHRFILEKAPDINGDPVMIMQVFTNLISNAFKYSQHATEPIVSVSGSETSDRTIYTVADNGIGIDMAHADRIFQLFRRSDNVSQYEGSGVGLAIAKRIVERHGGSIGFNSVLGSGTSFEVAFPRN